MTNTEWNRLVLMDEAELLADSECEGMTVPQELRDVLSEENEVVEGEKS